MVGRFRSRVPLKGIYRVPLRGLGVMLGRFRVGGMIIEAIRA